MKRLGMTAVGIAMFVSPVFAQDDYDDAAYASCAACHLPDGSGVTGAFPPVRTRATRIAALDGGREYLVAVVTYGLMGTIEVAGTQYFGVMAGNAGPMSPADITAALNYLVFELTDDTPAIEPFTEEEVAEIQSSITIKSPAGAGQMRTELVGKHGDEWP